MALPYALVTDTLRREPAVCRISALASVPLLCKALEANSYWVSRVEPVSFYDPKRLVDGLLPVDIQFFESDLSYYGALGSPGRHDLRRPVPILPRPAGSENPLIEILVSADH